MGTKTILQIVNEARVGSSLPQVSALFGASERRTRTVEYAESAILDTVDDFLERPWTALETLATITTVASQEAYDLPPDYSFMLTETFWAQNSPPTRPGVGPLSKERWRALKNWGPSTTITPMWRVQGGDIILFPVPTESSQTQQFDYISKYCVYGAGGYLWGSFSYGMGVWTAAATAAGYKAAFTVDSDTFKLDDAVLKMGIRWRLLKLCGLPYAADREEYLRAMDIAFARDDGGPGRIRVGERPGRTGSEFSNIYPTIDGGI